MAILRKANDDKQRRAGRMLGPLFIGFAFFYFLFHVLSGEHGLYALLRENRRLELLQQELTEVSAQRKLLEHRTRLMEADSLDLDLLDEQSRNLLGVAGENEVVIPATKK